MTRLYETPWAQSPDDYIMRYAIENGINECGIPFFTVPLIQTSSTGPNAAEINVRTGTIRRFRMPEPGAALTERSEP